MLAFVRLSRHLDLLQLNRGDHLCHQRRVSDGRARFYYVWLQLEFRCRTDRLGYDDYSHDLLEMRLRHVMPRLRPL